MLSHTVGGDERARKRNLSSSQYTERVWYRIEPSFVASIINRHIYPTKTRKARPRIEIP